MLQRADMSRMQQRRFTDRVVIVTGASTGLGLATARAFAAEGAHVVIAARNPDRLKQAAANCEASAPLAVPCDVFNRDQVEALIAKTIAQFGRIDILVNNAGAGMIAPFEVVPIEDAMALMNTNFFGALNCAQAVLPHMTQQRTGHIVNIASVGGLRGIPNISIYSASKAALIGFSDALRIEVKNLGINVTVFCVGRIGDTEFFDHAKTYGKVGLYEVLRTLPADTVAAALLDAVARGRRMVIIPFYARFLHVANKFAPRLVDRYLYNHMPRFEPGPP